jgi:TRAP-type C4-dicarboxylate transport system substrate-binding protein
MNSFKRRDFLKYSLGVGAGLSYFSMFPGQLWKNNLVFADEVQKEKVAKYIFNFSSPYITDNYLTTPHAHLEIKTLIEKHTKNKVYVKIHEGGVNGIGAALSNSVKFGKKSQGALLSVSNLVPMVPELDTLNIPFWSSNETEYVRLFNSQAWDKYALSKMKKSGIQVLFPYVVGARTATSTRKYGKLIKAPEDFVGIKFRIPGSKSLKVFYTLTKAKPVKIAWGLCARTARGGRYDALDPSIAGLYSGPEELNKELGIISEIESVHDGWVAIGNNDFIDGMDSVTRTQFKDAFKEIQVEQLKLYQQSKEYCIKEFAELGTKVYTPTPDERKVLADAFGHTQPAWEPVKKGLLGDNGLAIFDELFKTAKG